MFGPEEGDMRPVNARCHITYVHKGEKKKKEKGKKLDRLSKWQVLG